MKKLIALVISLMTMTSVSAYTVDDLLAWRGYTHEALGALTFYHFHCGGISEDGHKFILQAIIEHNIDPKLIHITSDSFIEGYTKAKDEVSCDVIWAKFDDKGFSHLLKHDNISDTDI